MATADELKVVISAESSKFRSETGKVRDELSKLNSAASNATSKLSVGMIAAGTAIGRAITGALSKASQAITSTFDSAVTRLDTLNNFPRVMSNLAIGAEDSTRVINLLSDKLLGLPTTLDSAALAVQRFTAANNDIEASTAIYLALNDALLAGGTSAEAQAGAMEQLAQAYGKGKPDAMEWRKMLETMPAQLKQVATSLGYTSTAIGGDLQSALVDGTLSMNKFMMEFVKLDKEGLPGFQSFRDQAFNASNGVQTALINLKNAFVRMGADIMNAIGQTNIAGFFNGIKNAVVNVTQYIVAFIRVVLTAINALRALFGQSALSFGKTESSASGAATAVGGIGTAADNASDAIGNTSKAAKKLQKQLAGFDEMTVLRENDTSGGGGGGTSAGGVGNMGDLSGFEIDLGSFEDTEDKITKIAENIKKKLKEMFDFEKIGKAIKRFADDVNKFLKPVGKIFNDLWGYIKPFISWAGNELLPAFLNALGGAINFVGQVIGAIWDNALKPFIDYFLKPIAQFTGGVIVNVLNAIGDGLRAIAENKVAVDIIAGIAVGIGAAVVAYQAYEVVMGAVNAAELLHQGILGVSTTATGAYALGVNLVTGAYGAATTAAGLFSTELLASIAPFAAVGVAVAGIVAAIGIFGEQIENARRKNESLKGSTEAYLPVLDESAEKYDKNKDGVLSYTESLERLEDALLAQTNAEMNMISAEKTLAEKTDALKQYSDKYGLSVDKLIELHREGKLNTVAVGDEYDNLRMATLEVEAATLKVKDATKKYNDEQGNLQSIANQTKEQYDALGKKMVESAENGKMATTEWYQQEIELQRLQEEIKETGKNVGVMKDWYSEAVAAGTKLGEGLTDGFQCKVPDAQRSGLNLGQGAINGINNKWQETYNAGWNQADAGIQGFNARARIHSPSREMMKSGSYFTEGIAIGIESMVGDVKDQAAAVADAANTSFTSNIKSFQDELKTTSADFASKNEVNLASVVEANSQAHVVVKVGEDTLVDRIIKGINNASFLGNNSVINI